MTVENEFKKLKTFDSSYFRRKNYFGVDDTQNYWVFQSIYIYVKRIAGAGAGDYISSWKSKGLSDENIAAPSAPYNFLNLSLEYFGTKPRVRFSGSCVKQNAITYKHGKSVNIYIIF